MSPKKQKDAKISDLVAVVVDDENKTPTALNSYEFQEQINEEYEELMAKRGEKIPSMEELLEDEKKITEVISGFGGSTSKGKEPESTSKSTRQYSDDTDDIEQEIAKLQEMKISNPSKKVETVPRIKPHFARSQEIINPAQPDYQESFASQEETAEMRDELSSIAARLANLEATIEGLLSERKNLPEHLNRLNNEITKQFTVMNERLNASIEAGISTKTAQQALEQLTNVSSSSNVVLSTVEQELSEPPTKASQTAKSHQISGGRKKIRLID